MAITPPTTSSTIPLPLAIELAPGTARVKSPFEPPQLVTLFVGSLKQYAALPAARYYSPLVELTDGPQKIVCQLGIAPRVLDPTLPSQGEVSQICLHVFPPPLFGYQVMLFDIHCRFSLFLNGKRTSFFTARMSSFTPQNYNPVKFHLSRDWIINPIHRVLDSAGSLDVHCEVMVSTVKISCPFPKLVPTITPEVLRSQAEARTALANDFAQLYLHGVKSADVTLMVWEHVAEEDSFDDGRGFSRNRSVVSRKFPAHKVVLTARSPVFAAMFQHDLSEAQTNTICIEDTDSRVVNEFLRFLYTGTVDQRLESVMEELLMLAEKYQVESLKTVCEDHLGATLTVDSVCRLLLVAELYQATRLRSYAINFITENGSLILPTDSWKEFSVRRPDIISEHILKSFAQKYENLRLSNL